MKRRELDYRWVVLINTTIAVFMTSLDNSILTISLPDILRSLNASVVEIMWVVMGYSLVITSLLLPFGRLADMKGRVRLFNIGLVLFTVASMMCGLSQSGMQLVMARFIQGIGAAMVMANSVALLTDAFPLEQRGQALGFNMMAATGGWVFGSVAGGVITQFLGWRYVFFVNAPIGLLGAVWCFLKLRETSQPELKARFDLGGIITFPLAVASILAGLTFVTVGRWGWPETNVLFVAGVLLLGAFGFIERRVREPMMDLELFKIRVFSAGNFAVLLNALGRGSTLFIMSWYFQAVLQDQPAIAGLKTLPLAASMVIVSPLAGKLADQMSSRFLSTAGLAGNLIAMAALAIVPVNVPYPVLCGVFILMGLANAFFNAPNTTAVMSAVPASRRGVAAGARTLLLNSGQTMSIALTMAIVATTVSYQTLVLLFGGSADAQLGLDGVAFMTGLHKLFMVSALLCLAAMVCSAMRGTEPAHDHMRATAPARAELAEALA
ncbi:MAG TPA: MFS transporter [Chloroflexota bacterium]|jgi:EmrB/QacA subfamily drug resistance transporter|nr:MFS transporter [Chloroflexota bacterium]